jgi:hypothetical protein
MVLWYMYGDLVVLVVCWGRAPNRAVFMFTCGA